MSTVGDMDNRDPLVTTAAAQFLPLRGLNNCEDVPKDRRVTREEGHVYTETDALGDDNDAAICKPEVEILFH